MNPNVNKKNYAWAILAVIIITAVFYFPVIKGTGHTIISQDDWYGEYFYAAMSRDVVAYYHQFPFRTPYLGGGYPSIAHPFDYTLTPFFPIILFLGETSGLRIIVFLIMIFSAAGMFYLTKYILGYNLEGSIFSSLVFILCSWGPYQILDGNINYLYYYFMPWLFAFFLKARQDRKFAVLASLILGLILIRGGLIFIPSFIALSLFAFLKALNINKASGKKVIPAYLVILVSIAAITLFLFAIKTIPMYQLYMSRSGYIHLPYEDSYRQISLATKSFDACLNLNRLFNSLINIKFHGYSAMYFGYIPLVIFFLSIALYGVRNLNFLILLAIFTLIEFGSNSPVDLFKMLWHIHPIMHGIWRLDKYFNFFIIFFIAIISGSFFLVLKNNNITKMIILIIAAAGVINMFNNNKPVLKNLIYEKQPVFKRSPAFFQVKIEEADQKRQWPGFSELKDIRSYQMFWALLKQNIGVVNFNWAGNIKIAQNAAYKYILPVEIKGDAAYIKGYNVFPGREEAMADLASIGSINPDYKGEVYFLDSDNKLESELLTPNEITLNADLKKPGILIINQNYHKSWKSNLGKVINKEGLLGLRINKTGKHTIKLKYVPLDFYLGLSISVLTLISVALYLIKQRKSYA